MAIDDRLCAARGGGRSKDDPDDLRQRPCDGQGTRGAFLKAYGGDCAVACKRQNPFNTSTIIKVRTTVSDVSVIQTSGGFCDTTKPSPPSKLSRQLKESKMCMEEVTAIQHGLMHEHGQFKCAELSSLSCKMSCFFVAEADEQALLTCSKTMLMSSPEVNKLA